jgi:hypothetical protein
MSEPLPKVKILLDSGDPSERLHFVVLDYNSLKYMNVKICSAEEHIERGNERNYKSPLKNYFFLFRNDVVDTWNLAKAAKKYRKYPESFKNISLIWNNLPKNVIDIYEQIYNDYKELIPKFGEFVQYSPPKRTDEGESFEEFINYPEALTFQSNELHITSAKYDNLTPTINSVEKEKNEVGSDLSMFFSYSCKNLKFII